MTEARGIRKRNPLGVVIAFILVILAVLFWGPDVIKGEAQHR